MDLIYTGEALPGVQFISRQSIFLAGPTPRNPEVKSWRPEALDILKALGFPGQVMVPEWRDSKVRVNYDDQVEWEHAALNQCSVIAFWVPRDLLTMPAFTTNCEFGRFVGQRNVVYGRPPEAPGNKYLDWYYEKMTSEKPFATLSETMAAVVKMASEDPYGNGLT